ncbi:NAD(P)/FAD-dependent oxidoreductase [Membranihabitans marinus]|uniref:NAD(P)/FAD-dependent oxidoreductase n=1 Tax=Membranihabitans marinus TaxID=1227546 RepID=UPI001F27E152|nr:NAD(P)/FAD-dependent oxidoreductase [Membranihabitans marinus]
MKPNNLNIPVSQYKRIVILGGGFAGLNLAKKLINTHYQVVLLDRQNFHQFQPLFYQVAMAGLEPSAIAFPIRKMFRKSTNVFVRQAEIHQVNRENKSVKTDRGVIEYDYLVVALGAITNFFGNEEIAEKSYSLKSLGESLLIRNRMFEDFEDSLFVENYEKRQGLIDFVIVGGGPTGVEMAGALAEMKRYIIPKDFAELDPGEIDIYLVQSGENVLPAMSAKSQRKAKQYLEDMGVQLILQDRVTGFDGLNVQLKSGRTLKTEKLIWAAGITCPQIQGLETDSNNRGRLEVNRHCQWTEDEDVYAIGDVALMKSDKYPYGHPQVAQTALQMANHVAKYLKNKDKNTTVKEFVYKDRGSLATIGRNKAVADFPSFSMGGFLAWMIWLWVHLFSLIGTRNKVIVMINWMWSYITYDTALRLIIKQKK